MNKPNLLVIGDVHGCYNTFRKLLDEHWNPEEELLVQVGDLINKGKHSVKVVQLARQLEREHGAVFLLGNHEWESIRTKRGEGNRFWKQHFVGPLIEQYDRLGLDWEYDVAWFEKHPLKWENDHIHISHAGIAGFPDPYDPNNKYGVIWNRERLNNIGKFQVIGHTPTYNGCPIYRPDDNYCNVDTGAYLGQALSGIKLTATGEFLELVSVLTEDGDI
ncbi:MAG: serine/threonine protein phosphatase [Aureispira sp.]|nr:serine/threonine protein phosphatase [Aureispira sp.]